MKARLLVHVVKDGNLIHQELPEVEFGNLSDLDEAIQTKWHRIEKVTDHSNSPSSILFNMWRKNIILVDIRKESRVVGQIATGILELRVMQVLLI